MTPLDPPPPIGPPAGGGLPPSQVDALSGMVGMETRGLDFLGMLRQINELLIKAAEMAQAMGDPGSAGQLATYVSGITQMAQAQQQGAMAPGMSGAGVGGPPPPGPMPAQMPLMMTPQRPAVPPGVGV